MITVEVPLNDEKVSFDVLQLKASDVGNLDIIVLYQRHSQDTKL